MKFLPTTKTGMFISAAAVIILLVIVLLLTWSSTRFTRISVCQTCHEIFVDYDEYKPMGEVSKSVEDYNPSKEYDPGLFNVTVGCAECHAYPYNEYKESPHYDNEMDVRPGCVGCHEPHSVREILSWKFFYLNSGSLGESPFHAISNSLRDVGEWEDLRIKLAKRVREKMVAEKSVKCQACHKTESKWFNGIARHKTMKESGKTCINCHYNLVHDDVEWHDKDE